MEKKKVYAVVVTYNRYKYLLECIEALLTQSYALENIVIVNNASTDRTEEALKEKGYLDDSRITYLLQEKNIGGAGGFYEGMKYVSEQDYDYLWIMDDDTIPNNDSLEELLKGESKLISNGENPSFLASSVFGENGELMNVPVINTYDSKNGYPFWYRYLSDSIVYIKRATFVSLLFPKKSVDIVGLPCKDYFIWGDDYEYTQRLVKIVGHAFMIGKSKVIHKRKNPQTLSLFKVNDKERLNNFYLLYRNGLINKIYYDGKKAAIYQLMKDVYNVLRCLTTKYPFKRMKQIIKGDFKAIIEYHKFKKYIDNQIKK
ncbi:glycosyltransferase, group 2 family protein [Ligilactobacillus hayakitensis DSM 18933 = JCM 14209]|uniref:Glycosyltransferase, group 2 family protein n=1 Tax=Ligilactobacillus hayakitensis DSM 18933 = JCM 14209 TaxID=1423755 RepID=A0A0R1WRC0_9LACO|nr:glycosyltransferase family 2 protein [Ligilactobacillus hayakitensis]KRM20442.1 glycosyltransferase, group 2 family protein [Ligilactobacillus hayakitensis DSM 18933 = JCM 14209]